MKLNKGAGFKLLCLGVGLIVVFGGCALYKNVIKSAMADSETITIDGVARSFPKVVLADACNSAGAQCLNNVALVMGVITEGSVRSLKSFMASNPANKPSYVCFHSVGGQTEYALQIANVIQESNLGTCLAEKYIIKGSALGKAANPQTTKGTAITGTPETTSEGSNQRDTQIQDLQKMAGIAIILTSGVVGVRFAPSYG